jgi:hypothetical protein
LRIDRERLEGTSVSFISSAGLNNHYLRTRTEDYNCLLEDWFFFRMKSNPSWAIASWKFLRQDESRSGRVEHVFSDDRMIATSEDGVLDHRRIARQITVTKMLPGFLSKPFTQQEARPQYQKKFSVVLCPAVTRREVLFSVFTRWTINFDEAKTLARQQPAH